MKLAALKDSLRKLAPQAFPVALEEALRQGDDSDESAELSGTGRRILSSDVDLDLVLTGGIPRGGITEISGDASSGKTALALRLAAARTRAGDLVAYVDAQRQLYPPAAAALGVDLERFLVVSIPGETAPAIEIAIARATDILARARHFPLVIVDPPRRGGLTPRRTARLRQVAHATRAAIVVLSESAGMVPGAALRLSVWPRSQGGSGAKRKELPGGTRQLEIHASKGSRTRRTVLELSTFCVDHAPPRTLAPVLTRTPPGAPPRPVSRRRSG